MKYLVSIIIFVLFYSGCTNEGMQEDTIPTVTFTGVLSADLAQSQSVGKSIGDIGDISEIIACAVDENGEFHPERTQTAPVGTDGTFSLNLSSDSEWILMTGNPNATTLEARIGNFISLSEDNNTRLSSFPMYDASGEIDAGYLSALADETLSSNIISQLNNAFGLPSTDLIQLSHVDALTKYVKNAYINNASGSTTRFKYVLRFGFANFTVTYNNFSDVALYGIPSSEFLVFSNHASFVIDENLSLIAPDLNSSVLSVANWPVYYNPSNYVSTYLTYPLSQGFYKLNNQTETIAVFDIAGTDIYDDDGNFTGIMPSIKLVLNADGNTTGMSIAMFGFNKSTNNFEKITSYETLKRYMKLAWVDFGSKPSSTFDSFSYDLLFDQQSYTEFLSGTTGTMTFSNGEFYLPFPGTTPTASTIDPNDVIGLGIRFFSMGGVELDYNFDFQP